MKELSPKELKAIIDGGRDVQIIDIREYHEVESGNIGGLHIPMSEVMSRLDEIRKDCPVVVHCKSGARASAMVYALTTEKNRKNIYHLKGGIEAWVRDIDPKITVY